MGRMSELSAAGKAVAARVSGVAVDPLRGAVGARKDEHAVGAPLAGHPAMSEVRSSPLTNRGELEEPAIASHDDVHLVMSDTGELKVVSVRVPVNGQIAMIDGMRFVIGEETFAGVVDGVDDEAYVRAASEALEGIFGFGLTRNLGQRRDFYGETWELGDNWGHVGFGGARQNATILVALSGQGTIAAKPGWESRLHAFLVSRAKRPVITRVDLAHDWFEGEVTVDQLDQMHTDGFFTNAYTIPDCQHAGNWKFPNGKGRTVYIGTRKAGLMFRGYEKGMEQGDTTSPWVRGEVEMSNKSRLIPFDVLLDPSGYFMGAYRKAFAHLTLTVTPQRAEIKRKTAQNSVDASLKLINTQYGKYIGVLADFFGAEEFVQMVRNRLGEWPKRLKVPDYFYADTPVHRQERRQSFNEFELDPSDYSGALGKVV